MTESQKHNGNEGIRGMAILGNNPLAGGTAGSSCPVKPQHFMDQPIWDNTKKPQNLDGSAFDEVDVGHLNSIVAMLVGYRSHFAISRARSSE
jgi:hypothetical protein